MDSLLLHAKTRSQLDAFAARPAQTLMLIAPVGSGKGTLARSLAAILLAIDLADIENHPFLFSVTAPPGKQDVPIESIRQLIKDLSLRVPSGRPSSINRVVIIDEARKLSIEAQNALLKLLEEPPPSTMIILNVANETDLLPTVVSRAQQIHILPPSLEQSISYFSSYPANQVEANWRLSQGAAGLLSALLEDKEHPLKLAVESAKRFLTALAYERFLQLQELSRDQSRFDEFIEAMSLSLAALQASTIKRGTKNQRKLLAMRRLLAKAAEHKKANTNLKLLYLDLCLNFNL